MSLQTFDRAPAERAGRERLLMSFLSPSSVVRLARPGILEISVREIYFFDALVEGVQGSIPRIPRTREPGGFPPKESVANEQNKAR